MVLIRSILFNVLFYLNLIALMLAGAPLLLTGDRRKAQMMALLWARSSIWLLDRVCGIKVVFRGLEHRPPGAFIIAAKHQSFMETFGLILIAPDFTFVLKRELTFIPLFGWYLKGAHLIAIDRAKRASALAHVTREARKALALGRQFIIFPEGTRRPVAAPPAYKGGAALIYAESGVVCVPVALNTGLFWPRRSFLRRPGTIVIECLEPIQPGLDRKNFAKLLQSRVELATDRLVNEAVRADPGLRVCLAVAPGPEPVSG